MLSQTPSEDLLCIRLLVHVCSPIILATLQSGHQSPHLRDEKTQTKGFKPVGAHTRTYTQNSLLTPHSWVGIITSRFRDEKTGPERCSYRTTPPAPPASESHGAFPHVLADPVPWLGHGRYISIVGKGLLKTHIY